MLYLKNSLVNLTIILFSLFFITTLVAESGDFIFPKKKNLTIKPVEKKQIKIGINKNLNTNILPQKNPFRENFIKKKV